MGKKNKLRLADFIIGGAPRSATTWLCNSLDAHPCVYMAKPYIPEPKFFHRDELYARGLDWYRETFFASSPPRALLGEKTSYYLENPDSPDRIRLHLPEVRLIFLLRDPVERAFSNYLWSMQNGLETESFERALELEASREANLQEKWRQVRPFSYFDRGLYAKQLRRYYNLFPDRQILCLKTEDIARDPNVFMARLFDFLGLAVPEIDYRRLGVINATSSRRAVQIDPYTRQRLCVSYASAQEELVALLGKEFLTW